MKLYEEIKTIQKGKQQKEKTYRNVQDRRESRWDHKGKKGRAYRKVRDRKRKYVTVSLSQSHSCQL